MNALQINKDGIWSDAQKDVNHFYDESLSDALVSFFKSERARTVADLGCGLGYYVKNLCDNDIFCVGFDGNPNTPENTDGYGNVLDLSKPIRFKAKYDWVMSLEVGEHIPKNFEQVFLENIHYNNNHGVVLSWAVEGQIGEGHINCRNNDYIKDRFSNWGYINDVDLEIKLRKSVTNCWWFKNTIMVFKRVLNSGGFNSVSG